MHILSLIVAIACILFGLAAGPYTYCLSQEPWKLQGLSNIEVEKKLPLYSSEDISTTYQQPAMESWASGTTLPPGGSIIRYWVFFTQPLDVMYDKHGRVINYFTSYE